MKQQTLNQILAQLADIIDFKIESLWIALYKLSDADADKLTVKEWLRYILDMRIRKFSSAPDSECYTLPDGMCVADKCKLHGPTNG